MFVYRRFRMIIASIATATIMAVTSTVPANTDLDRDGLKDSIEVALGTDIYNADSDGDGYLDGEEVIHGYNPLGKVGDRKVARRIEVDLSKQQLHYFFNNVKIGSYYVSTGRLSAKTPTGNFKILRKVPVKHYLGINVSYPNTKWNLEFKRGYYIHSAYWHNDFGVKPRSGGCINLTLPDAEQMYQYLDAGDKVVVYGKTPLKPLAKPANVQITAKKSAPVL